MTIYGLDFGGAFYKITAVRIYDDRKENVVRILENVYSQKKSEYPFYNYNVQLIDRFFTQKNFYKELNCIPYYHSIIRLQRITEE